MKAAIAVILFLCFSSYYCNAQPQHIQVYGRVLDSLNCATANTKISIIYNNIFLAWGYTDDAGNYCLWYENFGGIDRVDLLLEYKGNEIYYQEDIMLENNKAKINFILAGSGDNFEFQEKKYCMRPSKEQLASANPNQLNTLSFRPYGRMARNVYEPQFYHKKVSYEFLIIDNNKQPVKNARVKIIVADDKPRWGTTDENGKLQMHMYFDAGALDGKIFVNADGHKNKKLLLQKFGINNGQTIKLKKAKKA